MDTIMTNESNLFMKTSIVLALGMALSWGAAPAAAGEYRCDEDVSKCLKSMARHLNNKGWVGIEIDSDEEGGPMTVRAVMSDSPAEEFGFQAGDQLVSFNKISYSEKNRLELKKTYAQAAPGDQVTFVVARQGEEVELKIKLGVVPETLVASWIGQHMLDHHTQKSAEGSD